MPRDGSTGSGAGGLPPAQPIIGQEVDAPFAVLPDPASLFDRRRARFETLAAGHQIEPYLRLLGLIAGAQHRAQAKLAEPVLPSPERLSLARANGLPPLSAGQVDLDEVADAAFTGILAELPPESLTPASAEAVAAARGLGPDGRREMMRSVVMDEIPREAIAAHVLAAAAVQVHYARLAHRLDVTTLARINDGACPACGGAPVASSIVGWEGAHGVRYCTCSICATLWHVVRIKCLVCGGEKGIAYHSIEGSAGTIMGETCGSCSSYVKMMHQHTDPSLEPFADDVASLALDMTLAREGWTRASVNPFLMGY